jgi:hypothetical protein
MSKIPDVQRQTTPHIGDDRQGGRPLMMSTRVLDGDDPTR